MVRAAFVPILLLFAAVFTVPVVLSSESDSIYEHGEHVVLWLNKIGPYGNPQEAYDFYHLPFCVPEEIRDQPDQKVPHLGEVLEGYVRRTSQLGLGLGCGLG